MAAVVFVNNTDGSASTYRSRKVSDLSLTFGQRIACLAQAAALWHLERYSIGSKTFAC